MAADGAISQRKKVSSLAEKLLAARVRQLKARLSQLRERVTADSPAEAARALANLALSVSEIEARGVSSILEEFGVREPDSVLSSRPDRVE
jgi:hypothetical protein